MRVAAAVLAVMVAGCSGEGAAALRVGGLSFTAEEISHLPESAIPAVADIAAWGQAVRDGQADSILAPLAARAEGRSRLENLPYQLGATRMGLGESELRRAYLARPDWELQVRHVLRRAPREAAEKNRERAQSLAQLVLERARGGEDFESLVTAFSEEPGGATRGGLLPAAREGSWDEPFWEAAVALQPGELSGVVRTDAGFHVIRLESRRPVPYEEADRNRLLRRMVPAATALGAMKSWTATAPDVELDSAAVREAWLALRAGRKGVTRLLARGDRGFAFTGVDLAASWLSADAATREALLAGGEGGFVEWVGDAARAARWSVAAAKLGVKPADDAASRELASWHRAANYWVRTFGLRPRLRDRALKAIALRGAVAADSDARRVRQQMEGLRPMLRLRYPVAPSP